MAYDKELDKILDEYFSDRRTAAKSGGTRTTAHRRAIRRIEALLRRVEVAERGRFIEDDRAGRNAVYIAKQKQLYFHDHEFDLTSFMCSCGISKVEAETLDKLTVAELKALKGEE